jgi:hypothetical protein
MFALPIKRRLASGLVVSALVTFATGMIVPQAQARQTHWGNNGIAASGCENFVTPAYSWGAMHTRLSQYLCWGNGQVTHAYPPQQECWVDWHGRVIGIKCSESDANTYVSNYSGRVPISQYARGTFTFSQCVSFVCAGQWRPAVSIRLQMRYGVVTTYAWSR